MLTRSVREYLKDDTRLFIEVTLLPYLTSLWFGVKRWLKMKLDYGNPVYCYDSSPPKRRCAKPRGQKALQLGYTTKAVRTLAGPEPPAAQLTSLRGTTHISALIASHKYKTSSLLSAQPHLLKQPLKWRRDA